MHHFVLQDTMGQFSSVEFISELLASLPDIFQAFVPSSCLVFGPLWLVVHHLSHFLSGLYFQLLNGGKQRQQEKCEYFLLWIIFSLDVATSQIML